MKRIIGKIVILAMIINMFSMYEGVFAATMRYYDNISSNEFPERLKSSLESQPWQDGFLDITKKPYNAKGDGATDDTDAIQKAIDDAYASNLIVYFPEGNYLVSKQLVLNQYPSYWFQKDKGVKFDSQRKFGNLLVGSTSGESRPKIVLKDNSNVQGNILLLYRYYNPVTKEDDDNRAKHYIATFRGIDIDMGNNPRVSAISMDGAQYCTIQDSNITGKEFNAGLHKIPGCVGSVINVNVNGGNIGILSDSYVPEALVTGVVLENQKEYGVKITDSRNSPVNLVGFKIISPENPSENYRAVYVNGKDSIVKGRGEKQTPANVTLTDGTIEVKGDKGIGIESYNQYVIMKNMYLKTDTIINTGIKTEPVEKVQGDKNLWKKINNYAFVPKDNNGYIHIDGKEYGNCDSDVQYHDEIVNENPSEDFIKKHIWPVKMPSYDDKDKVNIVTDYGATPYNNDDDDSVAIQKAIDDTTTEGNPNYGKAVFIPRGHFQIKNTITLKKGTRIFGAGKNISVIHESIDFNINGDSFIMDTVNDNDANIIMTDFAILRQEASLSKGLENNKYVTMLRVRGNNTVFRDVQLAAVEEKQDTYHLNPEVIFTDNAGGKVYNLAVNDSIRTELGGNIHGDYRRLLIKGVKNPLSIYQCGLENCEKTYKMEITDSDNITIYAMKYEEQNQLLKIKDSTAISIVGSYGYYSIVDNVDSIIDIENSKDIYLAGLARNSMKKYKERKDKNWIMNGSDGVKDDNDIILYMASKVNETTKKQDVLTNGDYENGINNWIKNGNAKIEKETSIVHQGKVAMKITNQKSKDDSVVQDVTEALRKSGVGEYELSGWIMKEFEKASNKKPQVKQGEENSMGEGAKAYIKLEIKHDGTTEYFTVEDLAYSYWNRINGKTNLSWKQLESAKVYIENSNLKTYYYMDEVSLAKVISEKNNVVNENDKLKLYLGFSMPLVSLVLYRLGRSNKES